MNCLCYINNGINNCNPSFSLSSVPWLLSCRVALALVGFLGFVNLYALRVNLSVGMVCMVNQTALDEMKPPEPILNGTPIVARSWDHCHVQEPVNTTAKVNFD